MRYLSRYGRFGVQIKPAISEAYATGMSKVIQEPLYAFFWPEGLQAHERELAMAHWSWNGYYQELDEATPVPPDYRIGIFDSDRAAETFGWSDLDKEQVETELSRLAEIYNYILVVPRSMVPPPWPRYDDFHGSVTALVRKLVDEGHDLDAVITYERANQNRPKLIEALELEISSPSEGAEVEEEVLG